MLYVPDSVAAEEENPLELLVVEEVAERPECALLTKGIGVKLGVVAAYGWMYMYVAKAFQNSTA